MTAPTAEERDAAMKLFNDTQLLFMGHDVRVAYMAAMDVFASIIGLMSETPKQARRHVDQAAVDLKSSIKLNWDAIQSGKSDAVQQHAIAMKKPT